MKKEDFIAALKETVSLYKKCPSEGESIAYDTYAFPIMNILVNAYFTISNIQDDGKKDKILNICKTSLQKKDNAEIDKILEFL